MDVIGRALRAAAARPHVLLAAVPGGTAARLEAERLLRLRDWPSAATPAQADLLLVAGPDYPDLQKAVDRLWQDLPAPRARVRAAVSSEVEAVLEAGQAQLRSLSGQRAQAAAPAGTRSGADGDPDHQDLGGGEGRCDGTGVSHGEEKRREGRHEQDGGDHSQDDDGDEGHGGHGGGEMAMPGGLPMAGQGEDRDGLMLDQLHLSLGPLLADWPAGLMIRVTLQGDVVQEAEVEESWRPGRAEAGAFWVEPWLRASAGEPVGLGEAARRRAAARLDSLARLLSVAGWPAEAIVARRLRDDLIDGAPGGAVAPALERFARRVGRSRTLAWLTRGIGRVSAREAREAGVSGPAARAGGDVTDRYRQWLADIRRDVGLLEEPALLRPAAVESPRGRWSDDGPPSAALIRLLPGLLRGAELAAARLTVASLDPDLDELAAARGRVDVDA
ncbi:hypothetical protein [Streptomyces nigra]|uniref:hypothetical protein n=1 Tax=Streptomyces nigra TaxID=1827580 RepID=UPI0035D8D9CC